jgi:xylan 1,4-beta-xylosidase
MTRLESPATTLHANVRIDAGQRTPLRRIWRYAGYDEPNYTYTANGRELLQKLGRMDDGPYFIRTHYLLCSGDGTGRPKWGSSNAYTEDAAGNAVYDWTIVDRIFDTYLETGCVPFVEIGFMPEALTTAPAGTPYSDLREGGWRYPPRDYGRWQELIAALAAHCLERYGLREVRRWYWELWNEPDIFYWAGTVEEYCRLYDHSVAGLLGALPQAHVGGPGTTSPANPRAGEFLRRFLEHCVSGVNAVTGEQGTRLDFLSFHTKGGGYRRDDAAAKGQIGRQRIFDGLLTRLDDTAS